jgi:molybdenum-dependent DNA-binding transcriptional regulator ModE
MDIFRKEIRVFEEVALSGSLSKASEKLSINQPSISKSLQRLEKDLKGKLLIRGREGIQLTQKGHDLMKLISQCQRDSEHSRPEIKQLTIGCHQSLAMETLPQLLPQIRNAFPGIEISFKFLPSVEVTRKVAGLEIDLGIVINPLKRKQLIFKSLGKDFVGLWQSKLTEIKPKVILIHPDMYLAAKIQPEMECQLIPDYEVISQIISTNPEYAAILPEIIAKRYKLKLVNQKKLFEVKVNLIMHEERFSKEIRKKLMDLFRP